ncbi:MAG: hypothetical protein IKV20_04175 [Clostridia bacterium]|nr:hypothetical protein [Clostridia bacterium]
MKKHLLILLIAALILSVLTIPALAAEGAAEEYAKTNVFEQIYTELLSHSDKILSALAFVASLLLAFTYKKGLLPLVKGALNTLGSSVTTLKEQTESVAGKADEAMSAALTRLMEAEKLMLSLTERLEVLENELCDARHDRAKLSDIQTVISTQVDMLYEIFISSSIPLYQKEAVGEKICAMKRALAEKSEDGANE